MSSEAHSDTCRILIFNNGYLAPGLSGGAKNIVELATEWSATTDVQVVLPEVAEGVLPLQVSRQTYPSHFPTGLLDTVWTYLRRMGRVRAILRQLPADVVVSSSSLLHDVWPAWLHRRRHGSRMVVFVFHLVPNRSASGWGRRLQFLLSSSAQGLCLRLYRHADVVFAGNQLVRDALIERGISTERIQVYYPAMDKEAIRSAEPIPRYDALFIGRLVARKGIFDILDAVEGLALNVGLVGDGEDRAALEAEITRRALSEHVDVLGALPGPELFGLLRGCRFLLFPSYEEGYGMVIAEAMIAEKPVITYGLPHYPETFGEGLITVPVGDGKALRKAVEDFLAGRIDAAASLARYREARLYSRAEAAAFCLARIRPVA